MVKHFYTSKQRLEQFIKGHGHCDNMFNGMRCQLCPIARDCTDALSMDIEVINKSATKRYVAAIAKYKEKFGNTALLEVLV